MTIVTPSPTVSPRVNTDKRQKFKNYDDTSSESDWDDLNNENQFQEIDNSVFGDCEVDHSSKWSVLITIIQILITGLMLSKKQNSTTLLENYIFRAIVLSKLNFLCNFQRSRVKMMKNNQCKWTEMIMVKMMNSSSAKNIGYDNGFENEFLMPRLIFVFKPP